MDIEVGHNTLTAKGLLPYVFDDNIRKLDSKVIKFKNLPFKGWKDYFQPGWQDINSENPSPPQSRGSGLWSCELSSTGSWRLLTTVLTPIVSSSYPELMRNTTLNSLTLRGRCFIRLEKCNFVGIFKAILHEKLTICHFCTPSWSGTFDLYMTNYIIYWLVTTSWLTGPRCWSSVGKSPEEGPQKVSIGPRCATMGLIAHELGKPQWASSLTVTSY